MRTRTFHVFTETPMNEVPTDASRLSVDSWRVGTALKERQDEGTFR